ncbi:hypothetical protein EOPP23_06625 [Endozoicomonas sp. OPT23]|uniref:type VI secretion system baseplate subunit TssG n=1 Tax=Endozoicomonas sp. OPT23 TaxID=2072845 RepID=UPI00129BDD0C|nr:type VI secretion system baseplate subunit TssG [Endozoicomonas sp. OPT23]MRI32661.1 hypothetical protein [Endozoicomonas sp. OPT23]
MSAASDSKNDANGKYSGKSNLLRRLQNQPEQWQFAQAIRLILNGAGRSPVALALISDPGYRHTKAEMTEIRYIRKTVTLTTTLPSLTGINGVLPYSYQDKAHQLRVGEDNASLQDFYEIFNQRVLLNSYRSLTRYHITCRFEDGVWLKENRQRRSFQQRENLRTLGEQLCSLTGVTRYPLLPADHLVPYVGVMGQRTVSTCLLKQILEDYFGLTISVSSQPLKKYPLDDDCRSQLTSRKTETNALGSGALLGGHSWLANNRLTVVIHAGNAEQKRMVETDCRLHARVQAFAQLYLRRQVDIDLQLECNSDMMPQPQLKTDRAERVQLGMSHSLQSGSKPVSKVSITLGRGKVCSTGVLPL